jgi:hypothetical protein
MRPGSEKKRSSRELDKSRDRLTAIAIGGRNGVTRQENRNDSTARTYGMHAEPGRVW